MLPLDRYTRSSSTTDKTDIHGVHSRKRYMESAEGSQAAGSFHLRGMNLEEWVAPMPGLPCLTGL